MAENTKIEWADHTFNPWIGCQKVSPACDNCYAEAWAARFGQVQWGPKAARKRTSAANWRKPIEWNREAAAAGVRHKVFCASLADVFDNKVPAEWRADLFGLIAGTPHLDWLLLTKRPQNIPEMLRPFHWVAPGWPNVWIGTTVENQAEADRRIPALLDVPAYLRFLSCEPLLGRLDLSPWIERIDGVIGGGESGPKARPMHPVWARSLRDQCQAAGVTFHFKQWGEWQPINEALDTVMRDYLLLWPDGKTGAGTRTEHGGYPCWMRRVGKKAAGRLLDGRTWDEMPAGLSKCWEARDDAPE